MVTSSGICQNYGSGEGYTHTYIWGDNIIDSNGIITSWCIYTRDGVGSGTMSVKLKIFRINGSYMNFIGESGYINITTDGLHSGNPCNIAVQTGDLVGVYISSNSGYRHIGEQNGSNLLYKKGGVDVTSNQLLSYYSQYSASQQSSISVFSGDKYTDISTGSDLNGGNSWGDAYLTIKKSIDNVSGNNIVHIAEGDYSAQAAVDLNKNLEFVCEDYGGGNASPPLTVTLPPTT